MPRSAFTIAQGAFFDFASPRYTIDTFWTLYRAPGCAIESRRMAVDSKTETNRLER